MNRLLAVAILIAAAAPALAAPPTLDPDKPVRGIAVLSSVIGKEVPAEEILTFVSECRIGLVVFDFAWITHHWGRTDTSALTKLAEDLEERGVVVAAMYRPRALRPSDAKVHYAVRPDGSTADSHLSLCYAHADSSRWGLGWGRMIKQSCPPIRHMILYNVQPTCRCERCRDGKAAEHVARFLGRCRSAWPGISIGHVGLRDEYAEQLDFLAPFLSVQREADDRPVETKRLVASIAAIRKAHPGKPVVPLAKICWSSATKNRTEDVVSAFRSCEEAGLGFVLWYYSWIFRPDDDRYDAAAIVTALGGDPAKVLRRAPAQEAKADGRQWVFFDSRETTTGPRIRAGRHEVQPDADSVLISYLAGRAWGFHKQLAITLADTTRTLLRFPTKKFRGAEKVELRLTVHNSAIPVLAPFEMALHRVTEEWSETTTSWSNQPEFEKEPFLVVSVDPNQTGLTIDVTEWARAKGARNGLLLKVANPVPAGTGAVRRSTGPWTQPKIRTGTPFSDTIPWANDLEAALVRAKAEKKPILATVTPVGDKRWVSGYRGAEKVWKDMEAHPWTDERAMAIDSGLVKERAMMAALFTDPEIAHLVKTHFVPVRLRLYTYAFDPNGAKRMEDPLTALGTSGLEVGGPSLVFAGRGGKLIHACRRMGVLSAPMVRSMLRAVLRKAGVKDVPPFPDERSPGLRRAWKLTREGDLAEAARVLGNLKPPRGVSWIPEAMYLRAHVADRLGETKAARATWQETVDADPKGPWGSRAALRLMPREGRLGEWESLGEFPFDPLAEHTETGPGDLTVDGVLESATDYLLLQQLADGSWQDPFIDTHPMSGPGSEWDKTVPRTGLTVDALMRMRERLPKRRKELDRAIAKGTDYVGRFAENPKPHVWKLTYALHLQEAILESDRPAKEKEVARKRAMRLLSTLRTTQKSGGWSYMPPPRIHSFNTAPVLLLLAELRAHGVKPPTAMADEAAAFLESLRESSDPREFAYASNIHHKCLRASSCRTALCELALMEHSGKVDRKRLGAAVEFFFEHREKVRATTKVFESYFSPTAMHDAYHYYFGHYYTARALEHLPDAEAKRHAKRQMDIILGQRELDGSFVDAQMQGKSTSTAMALLTLLEDLRYAKE